MTRNPSPRDRLEADEKIPQTPTFSRAIQTQKSWIRSNESAENSLERQVLAMPRVTVMSKGMSVMEDLVVNQADDFNFANH